MLRIAAALIALLLPCSALAAAPDGRAGEQPEKRAGEQADHVPVVYVGVYLHDVTRFELKDGVFDVDAEVWAKWRGSFDPEAIVVANAARIERQSAGVEKDRDWNSARWRIRGTLRGEFPLHRFPYDEQEIAVVLELSSNLGTLVPDLASSGMAPRFSLTDWLYEPEFRPGASSREVSSDLGRLATEGEPTRVHRVAYQVIMKRPLLMVVLKLFVPLAIIALVAFVALFLPVELIQPRSTIGVTALLSCFAFQFTVGDTLPEVSYLTMADTLFLIAYAMASLALIETIFSYTLYRKERAGASLWTDRVARLMLPVATIVAVWLMIPSPLPATPTPIEPSPKMVRPASSRDVLRVGTNLVGTALSSITARGANWGLMSHSVDGPRQALYVERVPGVSNNALRFLASGEMEVTWKVRAGVKWSDGQPLTAADISLPWQAQRTDHVVGFETPDDRTLIVRWDSPLARALDQPTPWPSAQLRSIYDQGGYKALLEHRRTMALPALGPYHLVERMAKKWTVAEANPNFMGPAPSIKRIEEYYYSNRKDLLAAFLAGDIDLTVSNSVTLEQAREVAKKRPDAVHIRPSALFIMLNPDLDHPLLGKLEVRRAMLQAIDRQRIVEEVYGDAGRVAHVPAPTITPPGLAITAYDPEAARQALLDQGIAAPERRKRRRRRERRADADARAASIPLIHDPSPISRAIAERVVADLAAVGIQLERRENAKVRTLYRKRGHGGLILHVTRGSRDLPPRRYWNLPIVDGAYAVDVRHDAYTDEIHAVAERELRALYPERQEQLRDTLFVLFAERLPNLPLVFAAERVLADPTLKGWDHGPNAAFGTGIESWYFSESK